MAAKATACEEARTIGDDGSLYGALCVHTVLYLGILALAAFVLLKRKWRQKAVHVNLKVSVWTLSQFGTEYDGFLQILLANIIFLYCLMAIPAVINRSRLLVCLHRSQ